MEAIMTLQELKECRKEYIDGLYACVNTEHVLNDEDPIVLLLKRDGQEKRNLDEISGYLDFLEFSMPCRLIWKYLAKNKPLEIIKSVEPVFDKIGIHASDLPNISVSEEAVFAFLTSMSKYGLHRLISQSNSFLYAKSDIKTAIERNDYQAFHGICKEQSIDFSKLSVLIGFFQFIQDLEGEVDSEKERFDDEVLNDALPFLGVPVSNGVDDIPEILKLVKGDAFKGLDEDDQFYASISIMSVTQLLSYLTFGLPEQEEITLINKYFEAPHFKEYVRAAQQLFYMEFHELSPFVKALIPLEQEDTAMRAGSTQSEKEESQETSPTTKRPHKGRTPDTWLINQYALLTEDEARGALFDSKIWYDLEQMVRNRCKFPEGMDNGKNKESIVKGICAGLIYYTADINHIAIPSVANIPASFERTLVFDEEDGALAPRASITKYYLMFRDWYPKYNPANINSKEQSNYISEWLKSDKVRCQVLIPPGNYAQFQKCLEFLQTELVKSFDEVLTRKVEQTKAHFNSD